VHRRRAALPFAAAGLTLALAACNGAALTPGGIGVPRSGAPEPAGSIRKIKHVVIVVQENRSLNNLFMALDA